MSKSIHRKDLIVIYQEILKDIRLFTSQPVAKFYDSLFLNLDLPFVPEYPKQGRKGFSSHAMICAFIVMKCKSFSIITDLVDYLNNNPLLAHYCGFDISAPLPSYWTFDRFLKQIDNDILSSVMKSQVLYLSKQGIVNTSFIGLDSTPIAANISQDTPKSFLSNKFKPDSQPNADPDCKLGVHTASKQTNELSKIQNFFHREILSVKPDLPCRKMVHFLTMDVPAQNADCPCHHKNFYNGKKYRGCTKYITIPDNL